jgi:hypothetical protein
MLLSRRRLRENADTDGSRRATVFVWPQLEGNPRPYLQIIVVDAAMTARFRRNENFITDNVATQEAKAAGWVPKNYTAGGELGIVLLISRAHRGSALLRGRKLLSDHCDATESRPRPPPSAKSG